MTKKSIARQQKDANAKNIKNIADGKAPGKGWDILNDLYGQCVKLLVSHTLTTTVLANKELYTCFDNPSQVSASIRLLAKDVTDHTAHLNEIHNQHKTRTGSERTPDEGMAVIGNHQAYSAWMTAHDALIMPTWMEIMDAVAIAEVRLRQRKGLDLSPQEQQLLKEKDAAKAASDALDVNVVTDVVVNEVTPQEQ